MVRFALRPRKGLTWAVACSWWLAALGCGEGTIGGAPDGATDAATVDPVRASAVCDEWASVRASLAEGTWSGSAATCDAGELSVEGRDSVVRSVNLYRFLADLPPVTRDFVKDSGAQACSLMMHANADLSHEPPPAWNCYTAEGAQAAGSSNIATVPAVAAVDLYMADPGNQTTMGHRRWILSNTLGPVGVGGTTDYSCLHVIGGAGQAGRRWQAWPPPGPVPIDAMRASYVDIDSTGWTVQSDDLSLEGAEVTVQSDDGRSLDVDVQDLLPHYGSQSAIRIVPRGWRSSAGRSYSIELTGVGETAAWDVHMIDCPF